MNDRMKRLMAYIYMPLIFTLAGYLVIYIAVKPIAEIALGLGSMVVATEAPDFSPNTNSIFEPQAEQGQEVEERATVPMSEVVIPEYSTHYGQLTCEKVGLDAPVYFGDDRGILKVGAGQYNGSYMPGFGRTILLSAHNTTYFAPLQYIGAGDEITFTTNYGVYVYKVTETKVLHKSDESAYSLTQDKEQLVLYTCYPFEMLVGTKQDRLFVYADKISGPDVE